MFETLIIYPSIGFIGIAAVIGIVVKSIVFSAVALTIGYAVNIALSEDPQDLVGAPATLENFDFPTTEQGRAIQVIFGSPRIKGYNDLWHGDLSVIAITEKVKKNAFGNHKNVTVGYKYRLGLHYGWCAFAEELLQLRMGEELLFDATEYNGTFADGEYGFTAYVISGASNYPVYVRFDNTFSFSISNNRWEANSSDLGLMYRNSSTSTTLPTTGWTAESGFGTAPTIVLGATETDPITVSGSGANSLTSNDTLTINKPNLFGGKKSQGGVVGDFSIMFGSPAQTVNTYLSDKLGEGGSQAVPAFRGIVSTIAEGAIIGNTTSLKRMDAIFRRTKKTNRDETIWYDSKAEITDSSGVSGMNIAHIVHEIIVDPDYSLGFTSGFNDSNFQDAADTLFDEGFGLSFILDVARNGERTLIEIMAYANGFLRVNPSTNQYEIKLLRDDFDIGDLDILDKSLITEIKKVSRDTSSEIFNQVSINYTDPVSRETATLTAQNTALIEANGVVVNRDIGAPAVLSPTLANKIASSALQSIAVNPFTASIIGKRELAQYNRGDPVRIQMPSDGLADVVVRVVDVNYGSLKDGSVELKVTQDVFKAGEAIFSDPDESLWEDTANLPSELVLKSIIELPYYNLARDILGASVAAELTTTTGRPAISGVRTETNNTTFDTWDKLSTDSDYTVNTEDAIFCAFCETSGSISFGITQIVVGYTNAVDLVGLEIDATTWCQIEDEILQVVSINTGTAQLTLERGCLDTLPAAHSSGVDVFFISAAYTASNDEYADGQAVDVKILPETTLGQLELDNVSSDQITMDSRYIRPYNGANFAGASNGQDIDFTWEHRNRVTQVQDIVLQDETGITSEVGTTYTFTAKDSASQVRQVTGITGESYTYLEADLITDFGSVANAKLVTATYELISVRNTHESLQNWDIDGTTIS